MRLHTGKAGIYTYQLVFNSNKNVELQFFLKGEQKEHWKNISKKYAEQLIDVKLREEHEGEQDD